MNRRNFLKAIPTLLGAAVVGKFGIEAVKQKDEIAELESPVYDYPVEGSATLTKTNGEFDTIEWWEGCILKTYTTTGIVWFKYHNGEWVEQSYPIV